MVNNDGYGAFREGPSADSLSQLTELAAQMFTAETELEKKEEELKASKEKLRRLAQTDIPELMRSCGMKEFKTTTGLRITIRDVVKASIAQANRVEAVGWLDKHGFGGMVKRQVYIDFPREQEAKAKKLVADLRKKGFENVGEDYTVHPQTLGAWAKGQLAEGKEIPMALLGVHTFEEAKLDTKKKDESPAETG